jgi:TRAP-type C4-dicarboxylate transport system permease small subunit
MSGWKRTFFEVFNRLVVLAVAACWIGYGYQNFLDGFTSLRMPSMMPLAWLYIVIPISGAFVFLFTIEQMVNGLQNGFGEADPEQKRKSL